jgi:phage-related minor tail protein
MPNFFSNLFDKVKTNLNSFGQNAKKFASNVGTVLNGVGSTVGKGWDFVKKIPVIGDIAKNSPIGAGIDTGLGIASGVGNLLNKIGGGDVGGALNTGLKTAEKFGGLSKKKAGKIGKVGHGVLNLL